MLCKVIDQISTFLFFYNIGYKIYSNNLARIWAHNSTQGRELVTHPSTEEKFPLQLTVLLRPRRRMWHLTHGPNGLGPNQSLCKDHIFPISSKCLLHPNIFQHLTQRDSKILVHTRFWTRKTMNAETFPPKQRTQNKRNLTLLPFKEVLIISL